MAQTSTGSFLYPEKTVDKSTAILVNVIDTVVVEWTSNFKDTWLWLWCDPSDTNQKFLDKWFSQSVSQNGTFSYTPAKHGSVGSDWKTAYQCHWDIMYESTTDSGFNGPGMRITSIPNSKPTIYAMKSVTRNLLSSATSSISLASSAPMPTIASITNPPSTTGDAPPSKSGLSTGATAGIAIGVVVGSIALLALAVMLWRTKRKVDSLQSRVPPAHNNDYIKPQGVSAAPPHRKGDVYTHELQSDGLVELEPERPPQELAGEMIERTKK